MKQCLVYEVKAVANGPPVDPAAAVRIFVEFAGVAPAQAAVTDLNGRFFGGRRVGASYYPVEKWKRLDLAP